MVYGELGRYPISNLCQGQNDYFLGKYDIFEQIVNLSICFTIHTKLTVGQMCERF